VALGSTLHEDLEPLAFLLGTWRGEGRGEYATIESFDYREEVRFWHADKPVLGYSLRSWGTPSEAAMHSESGFWRPGAGGTLEVALAHPLGVAEIAEGTVSDTSIRLSSALVARTTTGAPVTAVERRYDLVEDVLEYELLMATDEVELSLHLRGRLRRAAAS
jgi:THAP4-like, heme-binding beta-barrel domain